MKPILYFLLLFSFIGNIDLFSQTGTFETSIDPDVGQGSNNGVGIRATTDGLIICSASSCTAGIPCLDIVKTDWTGNILWIRRIEDPSDILRFFRESCVINTDGSFNAMIAKTVDENRQFFLYTFDSLGNEIWNREYGTENKESGFGGIIQVENDHLLAYCSTGTDWVYAKTMLTKINKQGDVLWQKIYAADIDTLPFSVAHHFTRSATGDYLFTVETQFPPPDIGYDKTLAHVFAADTAGNQKWQFALNDTWVYQCAAFIAPLPNGNLAVSWCNDTLIGAWGENYGIPHFVAGMDTAGNMLWQHYFTAPYQKKINRLRRASNGDIIGCGTTNNPAAGYYQGWLFRFSPQGELLWEREYYHPPLGPGPSITAAGRSFNDFTETPDGGIAATGFFRAQTEIDIWLVKTDADGCMEAGCNDNLIWLSAHEAAEGVWIGRELDALIVYPNPASSQITVRLPNNAVAYTPAQIDVYNIHGHRVFGFMLTLGQQTVQTDLPPLPEGIYIIHLKGQQNLSTKLVIE